MNPAIRKTMKINTGFKEFSFRTIQLAILFGFSVLVLACSGGNSQPDLSAVPHAEALPSSELSASDKQKLLNASGKSIEIINMTDMQNMLSASTNKLYIYAFWHTACKSCLRNLNNLKEINNKFGSDKIKVIAVNVGDKPETANLFIRSENIAFDTYKLKIKSDNWYTMLDENWDGAVPAVFMVKKSEEIFLKYYKSMGVSELDAIIQTLII